MNNVMRGILVVVLGFCLGVVICRSAYVKNLAGQMNGYGSCPNCGDNWSWKQSGVLELSPAYGNAGLESDSSPMVPQVNITAGIMICRECLNNPDKLNSGKITKALVKYKWPSQEVELAREAVDSYKDAPDRG